MENNWPINAILETLARGEGYISGQGWREDGSYAVYLTEDYDYWDEHDEKSVRVFNQRNYLIPARLAHLVPPRGFYPA
jgi:hypothetical protein